MIRETHTRLSTNPLIKTTLYSKFHKHFSCCLIFPDRIPISMETYNANCHCGLVRFSFSHPPLTTSKVTKCNCSICTKNGYLLVYPLRKDLVFRSGEDDLAQYRFGNKTKPHKFCSKCGTSVLIDFSESPFEREREVVGINVCILLIPFLTGGILFPLVKLQECNI